MVVREDGTKWACQSCLKGHRVSGCMHWERELILVPKKGRPVVQCHHCRAERKKRSAHVKCDCGQTGKQHHQREKCIHLREAEEQKKAGGFFGGPDEDKEKDSQHLAAVAEEQGCCCHHGGKCTCALIKKESDDQDTTPPLGKPAVQKPRLDTTRSDGHITVFQNGHHMPVHRKNHAAHEAGMPYKLPMQRGHSDDVVSRVARRSVDSLSADASRRISHPLPPTSVPFDTGRRKSKSEQTSPRLRPSMSTTNSYHGLPDAALSSPDLGSFTLEQGYSGNSSASASDTFAFPTLDPMSGATDSTYDPWSNFPSAESAGMPNNNPFGVWPTNVDSGTAGQPALTVASSATVSEIDDLPHVDDNFGFVMPPVQEDVNDTSFDIPGPMAYDPSVSGNRRSLPPDFFSSFDQGVPQITDVQTHFNGMAGIQANRPKSTMIGSQSFHPGTTPPLPNPIVDAMGKRARWTLGGNSSVPTSVGRPTSQSVGNNNSPNEDLLRELFPGIDFPTSTPGSYSEIPSTTSYRDRGAASSMPTSFSADDTPDFMSLQWNDPSSNTPNDNFDSSMMSMHDNFDSSMQVSQDFSTSQENFPSWSQ